MAEAADDHTADADLRVLEDVGAVTLNGDLTMLTAEGREHVQRLRELF